MSLEENKAIARRYFEDAPFNPATCDEIFAPSFQFHAIVHAGVTPQTVESNPQSERATYEWYTATWGGWHFQIEDIIAEGDRVMVRWTSHGTQQGEFNGLPPTGAQVSNSGVNISASPMARSPKLGTSTIAYGCGSSLACCRRSKKRWRSGARNCWHSKVNQQYRLHLGARRRGRRHHVHSGAADGAVSRLVTS